MNESGKKPYTIPYRSQLQEKFEPGQTLTVKGSSIEESKRFSITLHCKAADFSGNDIPLNINVRLDEGKVVFNSFSNGEWGKEEKKSSPIKRAHPFDIRIRAHDNKFQVVVDRKDFYEFDHRLPLGSISHLSVDGDIYLNEIHWGGKYYPVPYESGISGGLDVGKRFLMFATPDKHGKRFTVNLLRKNGDIALHFNARFDEKAVVRNSLEAGEWGNEERLGKFPFTKGEIFDLVISNEPTQFVVEMNGAHFCSFAHRSSPHDISGLQIQGEIELCGIQMK